MNKGYLCSDATQLSLCIESIGHENMKSSSPQRICSAMQNKISRVGMLVLRFKIKKTDLWTNFHGMQGTINIEVWG